ncbi:MAG TPA: bifunctional aspartate kinase/homoserine dehydrogenase I [Treponemataceae bacterium]|nr:bifunctional aspartate kinase/homoserine dehydrogenase I [Treponemataceae bacterium]
MLVMKFGGTSMGSAERMNTAVEIIRERSRLDRLGIIISAVGGVSNRLQNSITGALQFYTSKEKAIPTSESVSDIENIHTTIIQALAASNPGFRSDLVQKTLSPLYIEYARMLDAVAAFGECPETVECRIMGLGEQLSVPIFAELLISFREDVEVLDSRQFIITEGSLSEGDPVYERIEAAFIPYRDSKRRILLAPGFISTDVSGKPSLLGRNGSDFSAALMAMGLMADKFEIWSDVDGIYTADPRIVHDAVLVHDISYEEAMELSFFGSKVLHPKTIAPIAARKIETWSLNTFNRTGRGTRIASSESIPLDPIAGPVTGITCLKDISLVSISGAGLKGKKGTAARIFSAVSRSGVSVLLITQSSSEYTISFAVRDSEYHSVKAALQEEFALEIRESLIDQISVKKQMSIVSIVGDGMKDRKGIAGTFFSSLAFGGINIHAIAQGSSERSISTVIAAEDSDKAVRIAHRFFFNSMQTIEVFLFGIGVVGGKLIDQIKRQQAELRKSQIDIQVWGIANSQKMLISKESVSLDQLQKDLESSKTVSSVEDIISFVKTEKPLNPVFVDCTAADELPTKYADIFRAGMHIITPNKRANSLSMDYYREIREIASLNRKRFLYETNVGAGLPIIDTFRNMLKSGDALISFSGIMSGSLSYIFGRLDEGALFSQAVTEAMQKGYTEPDPRDDLFGMDVARKALIIAREAGCVLELSDITIDSVFPSDFDSSGSVSDFLTRLPKIDSWFSNRIQKLSDSGKVLRFAASINGIDGKARVGVVEVPLSDPLSAIRAGENAFVFTTKYYSPIPLVIRGYGAGADVTAAGVFADILRTTTW